MSAFNVVTCEMTCPRHHGSISARVQFRYADTWLYEYRIGDMLRWGGNDVGSPGEKHVVALGAGEPCSFCGFDDWECYVHIKRDRIQCVELADGRYDFSMSPDYYIVIAE